MRVAKSRYLSFAAGLPPILNAWRGNGKSSRASERNAGKKGAGGMLRRQG